jgi:hypothetical protein
MESDSDSDSSYEIDFEEAFDNTKSDTGTDIFSVDHRYINFKEYPEIYDPFYPHIELITESNIMIKIIRYLTINHNINNSYSLRCVNRSMKKYVDEYMKTRNKKFYRRVKKITHDCCKKRSLY